jgi:hexulose-6-phosphate isomerase
MMKIGVTQIIFGDMSLDDTLELCNAAGYECVELTFRPGKDLNTDNSDEEIDAVREKCAAADIHIGSVIASCPEGGNLLSPDSAERDDRVKSLVRSLEIGGRLGADCTLLHPGQLAREGTYQQAWDNLVDALKDVASVAAEHKVNIGIENVWNKFLLNPRECNQIVEEIGSEWIGIYIDTANMMFYGWEDMWIRELGANIKKVHFKDFSRKDKNFTPLMDGDTDWPVLMRELRNIGYDDCVIHEVGGDRDVQIEMARRMKEIVAS